MSYLAKGGGAGLTRLDQFSLKMVECDPTPLLGGTKLRVFGLGHKRPFPENFLKIGM